MADGKAIKVLIVDDSVLMREILARSINSDPSMRVEGKAVDPVDAREKLASSLPDVITCDIQMPKMDGIEFIKSLIPEFSIPVIVVSSVKESVIDALRAGAVDFVAKPTGKSKEETEAFLAEVLAKIKGAARASVSRPARAGKKKEPPPEMPAEVSEKKNVKKLIAIGASTGGVEALYNVLSRMPSALPGIVVVQHIPPVFSRMFAERLDKQTGFRVKEAQNGDVVEDGSVYLAPGNHQMEVQKASGKYKLSVYEGEKINGHCPSVDILFHSVAKTAGGEAVGVIMTGMGSDGAKGLLEMRKAGARTIGQNEESSVVYGMPKVAYEIGAVEKQADLRSIPDEIVRSVKK